MTISVPLLSFKTWAPFKLDALGLVTLLGAEEVSNAIGALEHSRYTEYLPLFGTYLVAENKFTRPIPGFALYNVTDGVYVPIVNGWFSRWLIAKLEEKVTILEWNVSRQKRSPVAKELFAVVIGIIANGGLLAIAALQADWYGISNGIAMIVSVAVRLTMVHENRKHLNQLVRDYSVGQSGIEFLLPDRPENCVKVVITAPEDKLVAFYIQRGLLACISSDLDVVETNFKPAKINKGHSRAMTSKVDAEEGIAVHVAKSDKKDSNRLASVSENNPPEEPQTISSTQVSPGSQFNVMPNTKKASHTLRYTLARGIGWVTFAIHVISIGQSNLLTQILSVVLLVSATILTIYNVGNDDPKVGDRLSVKKIMTLASHKEAYFYLQPTREEERVLRRYLRLPYRPDDTRKSDLGQWNEEWWDKWDGRLRTHTD